MSNKKIIGKKSSILKLLSIEIYEETLYEWAMLYSIVKEKCNKCGQCAGICPSSAVNLKDKVINDDRCISCGHCYALCPQAAISYMGEEALHNGFGSDSSALFLSRRSVRKYAEKTVSSSIIKDIARIGACSPTASNSRDWELHFLMDDKVKALSKALCRSLYKTLSILDNGLVRLFLRATPYKHYSSKTFIKSLKAKLKKGMEGEKDPLFFNAPVVGILDYPSSNKRFGDTNTALAAHQMILYAHSLGLESTMIGFAVVALKSKKLRRKLGMSTKRNISQIFTLGYPDVEFIRPVPRELTVKESISSLSFSHKTSII